MEAVQRIKEQAMGLAEMLGERIPSRLRDTAMLRLFGLWKIPMLAYVRPVVLELSEERCVVRIPLRRRTKNHVDSMYIGVLAVGADCAGGLLAARRIRASGSTVELLFKDFKADYLRRPEGDVLFTCDEGMAVNKAVEKAAASGRRVNLPVQVTAAVVNRPSEAIAKFTLTLTLKRKR